MEGMLSRKPEVVTAEIFELWKETRKRVGGGKRFIRHKLACGLCGKDPEVGDTRRFVYANYTGGAPGGNFFVCAVCDGEDAACNAKRAALHEELLRLHKTFGSCRYCPDPADY